MKKDEFIKNRFKTGSTASYVAVPMAQNKQKFYITTIPAEDIFPYCFVARRDEDSLKGFQRNLNEERARDIAKYLDDSQGSIPTNIILSSQEDAELLYNSKNKTIKYKRKEKGFLVLDGQHRLYGYGLTKKKHRIPVAIYEGLSRKEEASLFIDINTNQLGVPASLLLDIKQVAEKESEKEMCLRTIFDNLNKESDSPMNGLLSPSKSASGKISRVAFNKAVGPFLDNPVLQRLSDESRHKLIKSFFKALVESINNPSYIRKTSYFEAFCSIFNDTITTSRSKHGDYKYESLLDILAPLENIDLSNLPTKGKTRVTKSDILPILQPVLSGHLDVKDDMV